MSPYLAIVIFLCSNQLVRVATDRLTMSPDHLRVSIAPQNVSFTCTAGVALTGCQFRWWDSSGKAGPLLELSRGSQSRADSTLLDTDMIGYSGRGLWAGDCGVSLQVKGENNWIVACRVRAESGGWTYAWADMCARGYAPLPHTLTPKESVVLLGGEATFTLKAQEPLSRCRFYRYGLDLDFNQGAQSASSLGRHRYLGAGLEGGECGLALANVSEADNGPVRGYIDNTERTKDDWRFMALIIARPPSAPTLSVVYTDAGVTATCVVHEGRPVANISWDLGDYIVRQDDNDDSPGNSQDEWRWPWMKGSVMQRLTLRLQAKDNGKVLKCAVSHVTLARPLEANEVISFSEPARETTPLATSSTTDRTTAQTTSAAPRLTPSSSPSHQIYQNASFGTSLDPNCLVTSMLDLLCLEYRVRASQLGNTSCPKDEVYEFRVRESRAAARTAELSEEHAKVALEAAKSSAKAEEARARKEEAWASNAEEELQFERKRRSPTLQQPQSPQSVQG